LVDHVEATMALMEKWVLLAMELGELNMKSLLQHKFTHYQPYAGSNWAPSLT
jgi:hypothetical protein